MTNQLLIFAITVFTGFFAVMNPIANLPVFLGLVGGADKKTINKIARQSTITAFVIIISFVFFGKFIFDMFHITIPAFKMTGGILLFYVGIEMLQSKTPATQSQGSIPVDDGVAISPLAIPILAGPGTIITALNYAAGADYVHIGILVGVFALMILLTYITFISSNFIVEKLGKNLISVIGKLMGLIIAIIGMDMLIEGIKLAFKI
jgi:multiple antibiotic resistance protein